MCSNNYNTQPLKKKVSITLDEDIAKAINELAEEDQRSFSQYINRVLMRHIQDNVSKAGR